MTPGATVIFDLHDSETLIAELALPGIVTPNRRGTRWNDPAPSIVALENWTGLAEMVPGLLEDPT